jgi:hypothetical protein
MGSSSSPVNDTTLDGSVAPTPGSDEAEAPAPADAGTTPFTDAAMHAAASAFNAKYCEAFERCDPGLFELTFGSSEAGGPAACTGAGGLVAIPASRVRFVDDLAAPYGYGSALTPDLLQACAAALDFTRCEQWVHFSSEHIVPDACRPAFFGTLEAGAPCGAWNQCASGRCLQVINGPEGACGFCVAAMAVGEPCGACEVGLTCRGGVCTRFGDVDASCLPNAPAAPGDPSASARPCHDYLVCVPDGGTCQSPPEDGGCDPAVGCSLVPHFQYCDSGTKQCTQAPFAEEAGAACGPTDSSRLGFVSCAIGLACTRDESSNFACLPTVPDGEPCTFNPDNESHCRAPGSVCFRDACRANGPAQCTPPEVPR